MPITTQTSILRISLQACATSDPHKKAPHILDTLCHIAPLREHKASMEAFGLVPALRGATLPPHKADTQA